MTESDIEKAYYAAIEKEIAPVQGYFLDLGNERRFVFEQLQPDSDGLMTKKVTSVCLK